MSSNPASTAVAGDQTADAQTTVRDADPADPSQITGVMSDSEAPSEVDSKGDPARAAAPVVVVLDDSARDLARAAAVAEAGSADHIGEFLVALAEDDVAITATFAAQQVGYLGWHWSVTLAVLERAHPTVSEVVLLPGADALLAPAWVPWDERIRPGDLGVGDLLPPVADDPRVVAAYLHNDDPAVEAAARELGIGRVRVLSREGRIDFAERLHDGSFGPTDEMALAAPAQCVSCAFYLPLAGSLGQLLGACGNELAPADGRVVDAGYGCGAHSETVIEMPPRSAATDIVIDELTLEVHHRPLLSPDLDAVGLELPDVELRVVELPDAELPDVVAPAEVEPAGAALLDFALLDFALADVALADVAPLDPDGAGASESSVDSGVPVDLPPTDFSATLDLDG